jgi:hypothetical protein
LNAILGIGSSSGTVTTPISEPLKVSGFDATAETLCAAFDVLAQHQAFQDPSDDVDLAEERVFIASIVINTAWAVRSQMGLLAFTLMTAQRSSLLPINGPSLLIYYFHRALIEYDGMAVTAL